MTRQFLGTIEPRFRTNSRNNGKKVNIYKMVYNSDGRKIVGFIAEPKNTRSKLPCIIWNRGGSRDFGLITDKQLFGSIAELASCGYVVMASQYSGNGGSEGVDRMGGDDIYDVLNLRDVIRKYVYADEKRIGMYGWSRGGMMTYMALGKVKWIRAAVVGGAPTDQVRAPKFRPGWEKHQIEMYGGGKKENTKRSAIYWPEKIYKKAPILIMHGSADWRVDPKDSIRLAERLYEEKVPFRLVVFEGGDHGLSEFREETRVMTEQWFDKYLKSSAKLPDLKFHGK